MVESLTELTHASATNESVRLTAPAGERVGATVRVGAPVVGAGDGAADGAGRGVAVGVGSGTAVGAADGAGIGTAVGEATQALSTHASE